MYLWLQEFFLAARHKWKEEGGSTLFPRGFDGSLVCVGGDPAAGAEWIENIEDRPEHQPIKVSETYPARLCNWVALPITVDVVIYIEQAYRSLLVPPFGPGGIAGLFSRKKAIRSLLDIPAVAALELSPEQLMHATVGLLCGAVFSVDYVPCTGAALAADGIVSEDALKLLSRLILKKSLSPLRIQEIRLAQIFALLEVARRGSNFFRRSRAHFLADVVASRWFWQTMGTIYYCPLVRLGLESIVDNIEHYCSRHPRAENVDALIRQKDEINRSMDSFSMPVAIHYELPDRYSSASSPVSSAESTSVGSDSD